MSDKAKTMPRPLTRDAPKFEKEKAGDLLRFLDIVKKLFKECNITDKQEKKEWLRQYSDSQTYREWEVLRSYSDKYSYDQFEEEIIQNYPEATNEKAGSLHNLNKVCKQFRGIRTEDLPELLAFIRAYKLEALKLQEPPALLTNLQLVEKFLECLTMQFASTIYDKLNRVAAGKAQPTVVAGVAGAAGAAGEADVPLKRRYEDLFDLEDVMEAAIEVSRSYSASGFQHILGTGTSGVKHEVAQIKEEVANTFAQLKDRIAVSEKKSESNHQEILRTIMSQSTPSYGQHTQHNNTDGKTPYEPKTAAPRDQNCWYCGSLDHRMAECEVKFNDFGANKIVLKDGYKVQLPDPKVDLRTIPGQYLKDKVNHYHSERVGKQLYFGYGEGPTPGILNIPSSYNSVYTNSAVDQRDNIIAKLSEGLKQIDQLKQQVHYGGPMPGHQFQIAPPAQQSTTPQLNGSTNPMSDQLAEFMAFQNFNNMKNEVSNQWLKTRSQGPADKVSGDGSNGSGF